MSHSFTKTTFGLNSKNLCYSNNNKVSFSMMRTAYQYKLKPNQEQVATIEL
ncbi:MAG: hypothetical protein F6K22_11885 [Okeania sp. SIO2F4]|uniref:hypothetical protein n=1 Tax=Okeania sp. SIO2F4 TaxID=2607790 RepID=UPI001429B056|nr:hypothetical protein [Okeania sp. SIO2F4]NES03483.1 hypothetical protein [Okeania sp. SIO2F4]